MIHKIIQIAWVLIIAGSLTNCEKVNDSGDKLPLDTDSLQSTDMDKETDSNSELDTECYSPFQNYSNAYEDGMEGCECDNERQSVCIGGTALICENHRWEAVEDGPCMPQSMNDCVDLDELSTCLDFYQTCIVEVDGSVCAKHPMENNEDVCTFGMDQTCNDNPIVSSLHGKCNEDGTCTCYEGFEKNQQTGRCM